jgi:hypothetical protein
MENLCCWLKKKKKKKSSTDFDKAQQKLVLRFPFFWYVRQSRLERQSVYSSSNRRVSAWKWEGNNHQDYAQSFVGCFSYWNFGLSFWQIYANWNIYIHTYMRFSNPDSSFVIENILYFFCLYIFLKIFYAFPERVDHQSISFYISNVYVHSWAGFELSDPHEDLSWHR